MTTVCLVMQIFMESSTTAAIAGRLWWLGNTNRLAGGRFTYRATMYTILETGGMVALGELAFLIMASTGGIDAISVGAGYSWCLTQLQVTLHCMSSQRHSQAIPCRRCPRC